MLVELFLSIGSCNDSVDPVGGPWPFPHEPSDVIPRRPAGLTVVAVCTGVAPTQSSPPHPPREGPA